MVYDPPEKIPANPALGVISTEQDRWEGCSSWDASRDEEAICTLRQGTTQRLSELLRRLDTT